MHSNRKVCYDDGPGGGICNGCVGGEAKMQDCGRAWQGCTACRGIPADGSSYAVCIPEAPGLECMPQGTCIAMGRG
jgi:hypothetical protein